MNDIVTPTEPSAFGVSDTDTGTAMLPSLYKKAGVTGNTCLTFSG